MNFMSKLAHGTRREVQVAQILNNHFKSNNIELIAEVRGKAGKDSDVVVRKPDGEDKIDSFEVKNSAGSRTDFGQFRLRYIQDQGWTQHSQTDSETMVEVFDEIGPTLTADVAPRGAPFPSGPKLNKRDAFGFWLSYNGVEKNGSLTSDIYAVSISPSLVQKYYSQKGDKYAVIGDNIYSLSEGHPVLPSVEESIIDSRALFRIKYHKTEKDEHDNKIPGTEEYSYTVALRANFHKTKVVKLVDFLEQLYPSEQ